MRGKLSTAQATDCDRCHAPLRAAAPNDGITEEGVNCDACHTIAKVDVAAPRGAGFTLRLEDNVRFGPLCDAKPHYFHSMGCSPLHESADFCAACHDLRIPLPGGGTLLVFPEYREWRQENQKGEGLPCQSCHMPGERAEVAVGSPERADVPNHSFRGRGDLFRRALIGRAVVTAKKDALQVVLSLTNSWAEHAVPTGLPERQLRLTVQWSDAAGQVQEQKEHHYGRLLVDDQNREAPFYTAVREVQDTRIQPGETRSHTFTLAKKETGTLRIAVAWRPISSTLAARVSVTAPPDQPMIAASCTLPLRVAKPKGRALEEGLVLELQP